jgi:hypothetical protein
MFNLIYNIKSEEYRSLPILGALVALGEQCRSHQNIGILTRLASFPSEIHNYWIQLHWHHSGCSVTGFEMSS